MVSLHKPAESKILAGNDDLQTIKSTGKWYTNVMVEKVEKN